MNYSKNCCQCKTNVVEHEKGDLFADSHGILNMWKNQLWNVHWVVDIMQSRHYYLNKVCLIFRLQFKSLKSIKLPGIIKIVA